jgi:hypothetical protein
MKTPCHRNYRVSLTGCSPALSPKFLSFQGQSRTVTEIRLGPFSSPARMQRSKTAASGGPLFLCMGLFSIFLFRPCRAPLKGRGPGSRTRDRSRLTLTAPCDQAASSSVPRPTIPSLVAPDDSRGRRAGADRQAEAGVADPACAGKTRRSRRRPGRRRWQH